MKSVGATVQPEMIEQHAGRTAVPAVGHRDEATRDEAHREEHQRRQPRHPRQVGVEGLQIDKVERQTPEGRRKDRHRKQGPMAVHNEHTAEATSGTVPLWLS